MGAVAHSVVAEADVVGGGDYCYGVCWHGGGCLVGVGLNGDGGMEVGLVEKDHFCTLCLISQILQILLQFFNLRSNEN